MTRDNDLTGKARRKVVEGGRRWRLGDPGREPRAAAMAFPARGSALELRCFPFRSTSPPQLSALVRKMYGAAVGPFSIARASNCAKQVLSRSRFSPPTMSELRASVEEPWASFPDASKERGELRVWCEGLECVSVFVRVRDSRRHTQRTWGGVIALVVSPCHSFPRGLLIIPH